MKRLTMLALVGALTTTACAAVPSARQGGYAVEERSLTDLQADMAAGRVSAEQAAAAYLDRIQRIDRSGPTLRSVIAVNPDALADARVLDAERAAGRVRGPLHGVPVLIKDNIETRELPTTAGSLALKDNFTGRDAPLVERLRAGGAVILGKTNLSEWANIRDNDSISGWSAVGGQVRNPYALDRNPCGSSSGSGAAAAASLAAGTVGTETDGSIVCPSSINGVVGFKPTVGLLPGERIVPISHTQDTAGPMTRTVADAAAMLTVMAGYDPNAADAKLRSRDYVAALNPEALRGKRIGVLRFNAGFDPEVDRLFDQALNELKAAGAELVEIKEFKHRGAVGQNEFAVLMSEFKADIAAYLATTPDTVKARTLADLIAFNEANAATEMALFGQDVFETAEKTKGLDDPEYKKALETAKRLAGKEGIDKLLADNKVSLLVAPTTGPAWLIDAVNGDQYSGGGASGLPAVAGYPHLTVPMGQITGLPVGLSFIGPAWSEAEVLGVGYAYEQRTKARRAPQYLRSVEDLPEVARALAPAPR
ncbi:MAG TPA: amidase [Caulobacteraceae bacterium]|nr:amidase [Caulobacteraceae bacterium]